MVLRWIFFFTNNWNRNLFLIFLRPAEFASVDDDEKICKNEDMFPASDEEAFESGDEDQEKYLNEFEQKNLNK